VTAHPSYRLEVPLSRAVGGDGAQRLPWSALSATVRSGVADVLGGAAVSTSGVDGGFTPGFAGAVEVALARSQHPGWVFLYEREAGIVAHLPSGPPFPRLRTTVDEGDWLALVFDWIDGRPPAAPWSRADLDRVLEPRWPWGRPQPAAGGRARRRRPVGPLVQPLGRLRPPRVGTDLDAFDAFLAGWAGMLTYFSGSTDGALVPELLALHAAQARAARRWLARRRGWTELVDS